jgi:hypothetical protein
MSDKSTPRPMNRRDLINAELRILRTIVNALDKYRELDGGSLANEKVLEHLDLYRQWYAEAIADREAL